MVIAILFMLLGAGAVLAGLQWRSGQWLESGRWVTRRISPHAVVGMPAVGIMLFSVGLMMIWPVAVLLAFGAAIAWIWVMARSAETGARGRLPQELRAEGQAQDEAAVARGGSVSSPSGVSPDGDAARRRMPQVRLGDPRGTVRQSRRQPASTGRGRLPSRSNARRHAG
jgi:hypothetical protein